MTKPHYLKSDTPITGESEDRLQRSKLAEKLARRLIEYTGPQALTVGICGPWGSGKTSFLNLLTGPSVNLSGMDGEVLRPVLLTRSRPLRPRMILRATC